MDAEKAENFLRAQAISDDFLRFLHAVQEANGFFADEASNLLYALEKPWKYAGAYAAWVNAGKPSEEVNHLDDGQPDSDWESFVDAVHR